MSDTLNATGPLYTEDELQSRLALESAATLEAAAGHSPYLVSNGITDYVKCSICGWDSRQSYIQSWGAHIRALDPSAITSLDKIRAEAAEAATSTEEIQVIVDAAKLDAAIAEAEWWAHNWFGPYDKVMLQAIPNHIANCRDCQRIADLKRQRGE